MLEVKAKRRTYSSIFLLLGSRFECSALLELLLQQYEVLEYCRSATERGFLQILHPALHYLPLFALIVLLLLRSIHFCNPTMVLATSVKRDTDSRK